MIEPAFSIGIEEEYLLVDPDSRDLIGEAPAGMLPACERLLQDQVTPEFLQSQIEVGTRVCATMDDARTVLTRLRQTLVRDHRVAMIAASTHPFASAAAQKTTPLDNAISPWPMTYKQSSAAHMICGVHVHVGLSDDDLRIALALSSGVCAPTFSSPLNIIPILGGRKRRFALLSTARVERNATHRSA